MKKKDISRVIGSAAYTIAATTVKFIQVDKSSPLIRVQTTGLLTSLLGTQPLLTESSPAYPIIKVATVMPEEMSQAPCVRIDG